MEKKIYLEEGRKEKIGEVIIKTEIDDDGRQRATVTLYLRTDEYGYIDSQIRDPITEVMGEGLRGLWGRRVEGRGYRYREIVFYEDNYEYAYDKAKRYIEQELIPTLRTAVCNVKQRLENTEKHKFEKIEIYL